MLKFLTVMFISVLFHTTNCPKTYVLVSEPPPTLGCGIILYAGQYFFINAEDSSQVIGIIRCPDSYGETFFKEDAKYNITFSKDTILSTQYSWMNFFENSTKIPERIIDKIERVKQN